MYSPQYMNSPSTGFCNNWYNQSAANTQPIQFSWTIPEKHCATSKCGKPCHKGRNCEILKRIEGEIHKVYCRECDIIFESDLTSCDKGEIVMIEGVYP